MNSNFHVQNANKIHLQGGEGRVQYRVGPTTDPDRHFDVDGMGAVRLISELDREVVDTHSVLVLAVDDGAPPRTATANLVVSGLREE